ncbi:MAG: metal ABC transporter ATP-binding protein [Clostridia bacterium]|nr:metal ABC transporter ATP-binding protein [Clostridia bacterium]MBQ4630402.1 metal ABC transporter ATP-binding protein [Clostridia bacterium]
MALITLENVTMSYEGVKVIDSLNLTVESGDYLCVVGENGSGKTTLLRGLLGLKKLDGGNICFSDGLKAEKIGYLPQQTEVQKDFPASVREVVRSGRIGTSPFKLFYSAEDKRIAEDAMEKLEIKDLAKKCYHDLSGGQQQRVLLARAICASEKLLILDEPVSGLDSNATDEMYDVIKRLNNDGMTVIMISHDIDKVIKNSKHILHLGQQKALFVGKTEDYKTIVKNGELQEKNS